jgi:hypothetical protein
VAFSVDGRNVKLHREHSKYNEASRMEYLRSRSSPGPWKRPAQTDATSILTSPLSSYKETAGSAADKPGIPILCRITPLNHRPGFALLHEPQAR